MASNDSVGLLSKKSRMAYEVQKIASMGYLFLTSWKHSYASVYF